MKIVLWEKIRRLYSSSFLGIILIVSASLASIGLNSTAHIALAASSPRSISANCQAAQPPNNQSLLVVLLDRSGSLTAEPGATDPNGYSTSVTKALADLWPGSMAVVPFSNDQTPVLGPAVLSDPTQRANLKNSVENYPIGGNTPLGPAMHQALKLLQGAAPGSRVIIVTDGQPTGGGNNDGPHQEQDIRQNLLRQFCGQSIPVSTFGLTIDTSTSGGQDANRLLTDIANGTGATYQNVVKPEDLARAVIQLYAQWLGLSFSQSPVHNGNAPVSVDSSATQVTILTFRSDSGTNVTLDGPNGQPIQGVQSSADRHYIIDNLTAGSGVFVAGTYTVHIGNDPDVQVYTLVNSALQIQIVKPTHQEQIPYNKAIEIQAKFLDNGTDKQPAPGEASMAARVQLIVNGKAANETKIDLVQNGVLFSGQAKAYGQVGQLQIEVDGNDQGVQRNASLTILLVQPPVEPPKKTPPPPCTLGAVNCFLQAYPWIIPTGMIVLGLLVIGLIAFIIWRIRSSRPKPKGWICSPFDEMKRVNLSRFKDPIVRSGLIQMRGNFNFGTARFELVFEKDGKAYIRCTSGKVMVGPEDAQSLLDGTNNRTILNYGDAITPENGETVSYQSVPTTADNMW
jgi:Mg-chelatase subunit ChlD